MQGQTGKEYKRFDDEFKRDFREAIARARAVETFPPEALNPENSRLVVRFLVDLTKQALAKDFSYKRYVA